MSDLTHRRILRMAAPIVLANATVPLLGLADTGVIGQLGAAEAIGAVAVGSVVLTTIYWVFGFLRMGTTGLTSQAIGAGDRREVRALLLRGLMLGGVIGVLVIALQWPLIEAAMTIMSASPEVDALARGYLSIRVWSAPAAIAAYAVNGWLIAAERSRAVMVLQLVTNGVNIALNVGFVLGLGWGVQGVAAATVMAEVMGLGFGLWLCRDGLRGMIDWSSVFDPARLRQMVQVNTDIMIRTAALLTVLLLFTAWGARFGDVPLAANQVLMQFVTLTAFVLDGFAFAVETLVGQALGARNADALRRAARMCSVWGLGAVLAMVGCFAVFGGAIIDLLTTDPQVRAAARDYLPWMVIGPVLAVPGWMLDGIFIGATRTRDMRNMMLISLAIYVAAAIVLMAYFGNHGLWAAMIVSWVSRGATLGLRYQAIYRSLA